MLVAVPSLSVLLSIKPVSPKQKGGNGNSTDASERRLLRICNTTSVIMIYVRKTRSQKQGMGGGGWGGGCLKNNNTETGGGRGGKPT